MYRSSEEQVFARIERIRARAARLVYGDKAPPPPDDRDDAEHEAQAIASRVELRLPRLAATFELTPLATDALLCLVAAEYDPFLRTLARAVQREVGRPWLEVGTIAELLDIEPRRVPELARSFGPRGTLRRQALVLSEDATGTEIPAVGTKVKVAARVAQFLVGDDTLPEGFQLVDPRPVLSASLVPAAAAEGAMARLRRALLSGERLVVEIVGPAGTGKRFFAEGVAAELGLPLLVYDVGPVEKRELADRLAEARRESRLLGALLCIAHWDAHMPQAAPPPDEMAAAPPPSGPRRIPPVLARFFEENPGVMMVTAEDREPLLEMVAGAILHVNVPFPTPSQRAALLESAITRQNLPMAPDTDWVAIARRYALDPARIEIAARGAIERALDRDPDAQSVTVADIHESCRAQLRHDLKSLAVRVTASHRWEDLVIPVDVYHALHEMIAYVRHAQRVYEDWGFGARHSLAQGVSALFAGPPGTGKTMCASVMARELDMELFRVDLSRIVSKWIGETEKNLGKVFDEAQRSNAIILFDEADALFAKRTEVKSSVDRYANLEVNFLLQRMEAFSGVTILTTNFEDTIDTAFKRRLTFKMRFEKPDADARAALWKKVFPRDAALSDDVDEDKLGAMYEMSGGNIRNAAVRAAFLAAAADKPIDMTVCMMAAERECREMGLLIRSQLPPPPGEEQDEEEAPVIPRVGVPAPAGPKKPRIVPVTHPRGG